MQLTQIEQEKRGTKRKASNEAQAKKRGIGKMQEKIMKGDTEEKNEYAWDEDYMQIQKIAILKYLLYNDYYVQQRR